jgi:hypothetical protein
MNVKRVACVAIFMSSVTAMTFAQATRQIGAWSIYTLSEGHRSKTMLQTTAIPQNDDDRDKSEAATLSVLCKSSKVVAIALHTNSGVDKNAISYVEEITLVPIVFSIAGRVSSSQNWAVSEKGHTLSPFSEVVQGRLNRHWIERLNETQRVVFQVGGSQEQLSPQRTFNTDQLGAALSSVGCTP